MKIGGQIKGKWNSVQLIAIKKELSNGKTTVLFSLFLRKEKQKFFVTSLELFFYNLINTKDRKGPIYLYCGQCLEGE